MHHITQIPYLNTMTTSIATVATPVLNADQQEASELAQKAYYNSDTYYGLFGAGGTGKTFCVGEIIKTLGNGKGAVLYCAPTNSALATLKQSVKSGAKDFRTLHSLLEKKPEYDEKGKRRFSGSNAENPLLNFDFVVVDEISMVSKEIFNDFYTLVQDATKRKKLFILCMGDENQHLPIKEQTCSFIEYLKKNCQYYTLTQVMRQRGNNPISEVIKEARQAVSKKAQNYDPRWNYPETQVSSLEGETMGYWVLDDDESKSMRQLGRAFTKMYQSQDWSLVRAIAWKNETVEYLNNQIRNILFKEECFTDYISNDLLIVREPVQDYVSDPITGKSRKTTILFSGDELIVKEAKHGIKFFEYVKFKSTDAGNIQYEDTVRVEYGMWNIKAVLRQEMNADNPRLFQVELIALDDKQKYVEHNEALCKQAIELKKAQTERVKRNSEGKKYVQTDLDIVPENQRKLVDNVANKFGSYWSTYYTHNELFHNIRHGYCITSHNAQGKTYANVFIDPDEIGSNRFDREVTNRCFYVAMSRASKNLILITLPK